MKKAYSVAQQKMITIREAMYPSFYGVLTCPACKGILNIRKGKRPCFAHERTEEKCIYRVSWEQPDSDIFPSDLPSKRYQHYSLLRNNLLKTLSEYYTEGKYFYQKKKIVLSISYSAISNDSKNMLSVLSNRNLEALIYTRIYYNLANIKVKNKGHHTYVWDILITFLMYSNHFNALEALEILISGSSIYPKASSKIEDNLNIEQVNKKFCLDATLNYYKYNNVKFYWDGFNDSELGRYCINVVDFVLDTFFYINWKQVLEDWIAINPAIEI